MQCTQKTFIIHQTFVRWALYILFKFIKSLFRHLGLAIGCVRWFSWTLWCYYVTLSVVGWAHTQNDPWSCSNHCIWWFAHKIIHRYPAPVPLPIFQSNLRFDKKFQCSGLKCGQPVTTKFCTCHISYCCDPPNILWRRRALQSFTEFQIRSKYH